MKKTDLAFTRVELLFCFLGATLVLIPAVSLLASNKSESQRIICYNNLRQIGRAFQSWSSEHGDRFPFWVPSPEGTQYTPNAALMNSAWFHFSAVSNYLASPRVLVCPADQEATALANNWGFGTNGGLLNVRFRGNAMSYSIYFHAFPLAPKSILSSDRNIRASSRGATCSTGASQCMGLIRDDPNVKWTNDVHGISGHLLYSDGSVAFTSITELQSAIRRFPDGYGELHVLSPK